MVDNSIKKPLLASRFRIIAGILALVLLVLAVLFGLSSAQAKKGNPAAQKAATDTADITIVDFNFQPGVVTITVGSSVRWTNTGEFTHTATSDTLVWDSGDIGPGQTFTHTFDTPGTYPFHCMHHPFMTGMVVVEAKLYAPLLFKE